VLLPGLPELRQLAASSSQPPGRSVVCHSDEPDEASCIEQLLQRYQNLEVVAVKHGSKGALIYTRGELQPKLVQPLSIQEVDPTGAGDCFDAAFICGMLSGFAWTDCGILGARAGAACASAFGPMEGRIDRTSLNWGEFSSVLPQQEASLKVSVPNAVQSFVEKVVALFKVVVFDMDQCAVRKHSKGSLQRSDVKNFAESVSPDFVMAVKELAKRGVGLAIATHSDLAEHWGSRKRDRETYILGDELVHEVLRLAVPEQAHLFFVVAFNPDFRCLQDSDDQGKKRHLRAIAAFYNVDLSQCVLFDDQEENCANVEIKHGRIHGKFCAFKSDPMHGFRLTDLR